MRGQPDDPKNPSRPRPPELNTEDREHVRRTVALMNDKGIKNDGRVREDYKAFMRLAWASENDVSVMDCLLVEEQVSPIQKVYFFAEKLPRDIRFANMYNEMKLQHRQMQEELSLRVNEIAALNSELANYRGDGEPV